MTISLGTGLSAEFAGENSIILYFVANQDSTSTASQDNNVYKITGHKLPSTTINPAINKKVHRACLLIRQHLTKLIIDLIPSYASILVVFNLSVTDHHQMLTKLRELLRQLPTQDDELSHLIKLPVYYSVDYGLDLPRIAQRSKLTTEQVIALHQAQEYQVYAIGFAPGFAYLGEVDARIAMPRLASPRLKVPKGAVAIADTQTAVYPAESPGGWNLLGLCPTTMFCPKSKPTMPIAVGDRVKFYAITKQEFVNLGGCFPHNN
jgi:KipI family sensor histidine kinase inhibitor